MPSKEQLAWCGGFYEGEGCANGSYYRNLIDRKKLSHPWCKATVSQKYSDVLYKFKRAIGFGRVMGPYHSGGTKRDCMMYVWTVTSVPEVKKLYKLLKPYLSIRRRKQFQRAINGKTYA